jgi:hypothetical protein
MLLVAEVLLVVIPPLFIALAEIRMTSPLRVRHCSIDKVNRVSWPRSYIARKFYKIKALSGRGRAFAKIHPIGRHIATGPAPCHKSLKRFLLFSDDNRSEYVCLQCGYSWKPSSDTRMRMLLLFGGLLFGGIIALSLRPEVSLWIGLLLPLAGPCLVFAATRYLKHKWQVKKNYTKLAMCFTSPAFSVFMFWPSWGAACIIIMRLEFQRLLPFTG